jgi:hypothetical protein
MIVVAIVVMIVFGFFLPITIPGNRFADNDIEEP